MAAALIGSVSGNMFCPWTLWPGAVGEHVAQGVHWGERGCPPRADLKVALGCERGHPGHSVTLGHRSDCIGSIIKHFVFK